MDPRQLGPKEIDRLLVLPSKAYTLLSGLSLWSKTAQENWFKANHSYA